MIPIEQEDPELAKGFWNMYENCCFCGVTTTYWHAATNNPVCPKCAQTHEVAELKNWFEKKERK